MGAVVFVGGVSLSQSATSIPIPAIIGFIYGLLVGLFIYAFASRSTISTFLIVMTSIIFLIGTGLFSKVIVNSGERVQQPSRVDGVRGDGPGSFDILQDVVWHLDCCNPENNTDNDGWSIFGAIFGWTNTAYVGTILAYILYWLLALAILTYMKWSEGRISVFGLRSAKYEGHQQAKARARARREGKVVDAPAPSARDEKNASETSSSNNAAIAELPR